MKVCRFVERRPNKVCDFAGSPKIRQEQHAGAALRLRDMSSALNPFWDWGGPIAKAIFQA
jgi:hypothetical protein